MELLARVLGADGDIGTQSLCDVSVQVTGASGAGIMLMSGDTPRGSICTTDDVSALIEQLQYDLGEGPCVDAYADGRPVLVADLADATHFRWPAFTAAAAAAGARAVFGFPLQVDTVRLGALNLYSSTPGPLSGAQHGDALLMADIVAQALLLLQGDAPAGVIASELEANADFRYVVHQASGMIAAQLDVSVSNALLRLRAYAFGNGCSLTDAAREVVARRLRFDAKNGGEGVSP